MTLRILTIGEDERKRADEIVRFASRPENYYVPGTPKAKVPGDMPEHVALFNDFRCVFSWTKMPEGVFRHFSISIPTSNGTAFPNPVMVQEVAHLFGFKGALDTWHVNADPKQGVIILAQKVDDVGV